MKNYLQFHIFTLLMIVTMFALTGCQPPNDDNNNNGTSAPVYAQTPCNPNDLTNCQNGNASIYNNNQIQFLNYQGSYTNGFCGCPAGYRPIINPYIGLSCAPATFFHGFQNSYRMWGYNYQSIGITNQPGQNGQWSSIPQVTYAPALSGTQNCFANAAATCDLRQTNSCGNGGVCRPTGGGSYLGICSYGRGVESYQSANGCIQRSANGSHINICGFNHNGFNNGFNQNGFNNNYQLPVR